MASKHRNYDEEIMSQEDYARLQGYQNDYVNATDNAGRQQAHQNAADLRAQYGYSMGSDGSQFSILNPQQGVSQETNAQLLRWQNQANNPTGQSAFYQQWTDLMNQFNNREPFTYDMASDGLYQQYAEQYTRLGDQAMRDTLGQAAALTGGYNSSYAQNAGQQAYQGYLDQLNDIVPELYGQARAAYTQEGQDLLQQAQLAAQGYSQETADYWNNLNYWTQQAANEQGFNQSAMQNAYSNLVTSISNTGYKPTDAELTAAGMTREEADRWANYYAMNQAVKGGSGGGGGGGGRSRGGRSSSYSGGGDGSGGADESQKTDGVNNRTAGGYTISQIAQGANNRFGGSITLDSRTLDQYLSSLGLTATELAQVKSLLLNTYHWTYSDRT